MEQKRQYTWNLNDIIPENSFDTIFIELEKELDKTTGYVSRLSPEMKKDDFKEIILWLEQTNSKLGRLEYYPHLLESVNEKDAQAKLLKSRANDLEIKFSEARRPIFHWIKGKKIADKKRLDDKNAVRLFRCIPDLEYSLHYSRLAAKHTLKQNEENIITNKDTNGVSAINDLRDIIVTEFEYKFRIKGEKPKTIKSQAELMAFIHSSKANERESAYRSLLEKHKKNIDKLFVIYQSVVKDWDYEAKLRGYESPISMRNFHNHVSDKAIYTLIDTCKENTGTFQNFFRYKAKKLGQKQLSRFDLYAPLEQAKRQVDYDEAKEIVLNTLEKFSPGFKNKAEKIIESRHIDVYPSSNKRSGAFCATVEPQITPYILLNYTSQLRNVFTLAHELGHGIHSLYANNHYYSTQHASLPLAETASTLSEMIIFEKLYESEKDKKVKRAMLSEKIADSYASIIRQNFFIMFEIEAHKMIAKGATPEILSDLWMKTLKDQFGDSVEIDPIFKYEWSYIPHIFKTPFYCYAYNFGELLSLSLYGQYKKEGLSAIKKIENILKAGGSRDPRELLISEAGIDMESKEFWQNGFKIINLWQKELEKL